MQVEALLSMRYEITSVVLFSIGFMTLLLHPNLIKKIIGLNIMTRRSICFWPPADT